jgi:hypothetical protein
MSRGAFGGWGWALSDVEFGRALATLGVLAGDLGDAWVARSRSGRPSRASRRTDSPEALVARSPLEALVRQARDSADFVVPWSPRSLRRLKTMMIGSRLTASVLLTSGQRPTWIRPGRMPWYCRSDSCADSTRSGPMACSPITYPQASIESPALADIGRGLRGTEFNYAREPEGATDVAMVARAADAILETLETTVVDRYIRAEYGHPHPGLMYGRSSPRPDRSRCRSTTRRPTSPACGPTTIGRMNANTRPSTATER